MVVGLSFHKARLYWSDGRAEGLARSTTVPTVPARKAQKSSNQASPVLLRPLLESGGVRTVQRPSLSSNMRIPPWRAEDASYYEALSL